MTGKDAATKLARLKKTESDLIAKYVYGSDHRATYGRFFTREGLIELEASALGVLMFRLETGADVPSHVVISLFFLAMRCDNVSASVKNALAATYSSPEAVATLQWMDLSLQDIHRVICVVGCINSLSPGTTSLMTCVMNGNVYNSLKSKIYPFVALKDMFLSLDGDDRSAETAHVYFVIIYGYNRGEARPSAYIAVTAAICRDTVLNILRHRFSVNRNHFVDRFITRPREFRRCVGSVMKIGHCSFSDIKNSVVAHKAVNIPVVRLDNFYVSIGEEFEFV